VTTRVDRVPSPERRVPQGAVGRVMAQQGDELDVMVVRVGVLRYARSELVPRKIGQVRYARAAAPMPGTCCARAPASRPRWDPWCAH